MADFGSDPGGGFNAVTKSYKANPTLENYLRLRRESPDAEIEVAVHGGMDQLFYMEPELKRFGIKAETMASVLDADAEAISEISLFLMEKIVEANAFKAAGQTHSIRRGRAVPNKLIDWFITCALDSLSWNDDLEIPRDLIVLIRERLGGPNSEYENAAWVHKQKRDAAIIAGQLIASKISPSFRAVGRIMEVSPSTVMRWFGPGEFEREAAKYATWFDAEGKLRDILGEATLQPKQRAQRDPD